MVVRVLTAIEGCLANMLPPGNPKTPTPHVERYGRGPLLYLILGPIDNLKSDSAISCPAVIKMS